jgi:hypothetical protein
VLNVVMLKMRVPVTYTVLGNEQLSVLLQARDDS